MGKFKRKSNTRHPKKVIRIYTEGKQTEPNYFNSMKNELRLSQINIQTHKVGDHTLSLVNRVIREKSREDGETEWWIVFDRDNHDNFDNSIQKAESQGIHVAYSNESFELWFILHFKLLDRSIGRDKFQSELSKLLGKKYEKNIDVYTLIKDREGTAIDNAKRLDKKHDKMGVKSPIKRDPSTTVYKLVERLRALNTHK